jgi:tetratricopeptide (TPR) repeat protein
MANGAALRRALSLAAATGLAALAVIAPSPALASPTVWSRARDPRVGVQDEMVRDAQKAVMRYRRMRRAGGPQVASLAGLLLRDARQQLAKVVASGTTDFGVRLLYVGVLRDSHEDDEAFKVLTKLLADGPPDALRADALGELAILHAIAGRREQEIRAYTESLALEPHAHLRSRLLSNRAEALMATGDVTAAVEGYRQALAPLTTLELFWYAPTTLFGMGVALDRSGNLESGIDAIKLARAYDPIDKGLRGPGWFFSPSHDSHWYWALGAWSGRSHRDALGRARGRLRALRVRVGAVHPGGPRGRPLDPARARAPRRGEERAGAHAEGLRDPAQARCGAQARARQAPGGSMTSSAKRDSLFGEQVLWSGQPKAIIVPWLYRGGAVVCGVTSAIATTSAVVVATALQAPPGGLLAFAAWMATLAFALGFGPKWWLSSLEFIVTDKHIIVRRGKYRRFIDRHAVSFARVRWHKKQPGIGDLELVRAVPTGALRRRLTIVMHGLVAPDRVWAIIRGVTPTAPAGDGHRLLAQRLDEGERVLWSAHPETTWRSWVPADARTVGSIGIAMVLAAAAISTGRHAVHALRTVASAGLDPETPRSSRSPRPSRSRSSCSRAARSASSTR